MSDREKQDETAPHASQDAAELNDDALEEVAGGFGTGPTIPIGPPPTFPQEPDILY